MVYNTDTIIKGEQTLLHSHRYIFPEHIRVIVDRLNPDVMQLEHDTNFMLDNDSVLTEVTDAITNENRVQLELEYLCMSFVDKCSQFGVDIDFQNVMSFLIHYGKELSTKIKDIGFYQNGRFPYKYHSRRNNALLFVRDDVYMKQIILELRADGYKC